MAINWQKLEDETGIPNLSAQEAAPSLYLKSQAEGIEAAGDIFGVTTPQVSEFKAGQEERLKGFQSKFPEGLFETEQPVEWWKEKAILNSMNQIVPYAGYTASAILGAIPTPATQVASKIVGGLTFLSQYNANFADTLQEHQERAGRELTDQEKAWAATVAGGVSMLDRLVPSKLGRDTVKKLGGPSGVKNVRDSLIKRMKQDRDSLAKSLRKGGGYATKRMSQEALTEAGQKGLQIGTSRDPGYLATLPGTESVVEEAVIAGPTAGVLSTPQAALEATSVSRDISQARRQAGRFNEIARQQAADIYEKTGIQTRAKTIDIPETAESIFSKASKAIDRNTGFNTQEFVNKLGDVGAFRPTSILVQARNRQNKGENLSRFNRIIQKIIPTGTASGEAGVTGGQNFLQLKDQLHGKYYNNINQAIDRNSKRSRITGRRELTEEQNEYIANSLENDNILGTRPDLFPTADLQIIRNELNKIGNELQETTGAGFIQNYLTRSLNKGSIRENKQGFIDTLIESSRLAYENSTAKDKGFFVYQPNDEQGTIDRATQVADDIIQDREPFVLTSKYLRDKKRRKGRPEENFEKTRSQEFDNIDPAFRDRNVINILDKYTSRAATRVASAKTFGADDASLLREDLDALAKDNAITQDEVNRVWDIYDAMHGVYKGDVSQGERQWRVLSKGLTTVGAITHLGFATLSSLPELVWVAERVGLRNMIATAPKAFKYTMDGVKQGISGNRMNISEGNQVLANLGFNLNPQMNERLDQLFATDRNMVLNMFFRSPFGGFLTQWTNFNRNWAAQASMMMMNRRAIGLQSGKINSQDKKRMMNELKEMGISLAEFQQLAELSKDRQGKININMVDDNYLNKDFTKDDGTVTKVRDVLHPYVYKIVNDVVINPVATNKPLWMSDPSLSTIAQLKTFPIVFGNTVMKRILRKLNQNQCSPDMGLAISALGTVAAAMGVAYIGESLKQAIRDQDRDLTFIDLGNTAGLFGPFGLLTGGRYGDFTTTLLGPALDSAINKTYSEVINPFIDPEGEGLPEATDNLLDWGYDTIRSSLGVVGTMMMGEL